MTDDERAILSVSSSHGYVMNLDYVNALRAIFEKPAMTGEEYESAVQACNRLGRDAVMSLHRQAVDRIASEFKTAYPLYKFDPEQKIEPRPAS
jgi:hypothetical protein